MITVSQNKQTVRSDSGRVEIQDPRQQQHSLPSPAWMLSQPAAFGKVNDRAIFLTLVCKDCACQFSKNDGCWYSDCQQ